MLFILGDISFGGRCSSEPLGQKNSRRSATLPRPALPELPPSVCELRGDVDCRGLRWGIWVGVLGCCGVAVYGIRVVRESYVSRRESRQCRKLLILQEAKQISHRLRHTHETFSSSQISADI